MLASRFVDEAETLLRAHVYLRKATSLGRGVRVWGRPALDNQGTLIIGDQVCIVGRVKPTHLSVEEGARLEIGSSSFINFGCTIAASSSISIGVHCKLGMDVMIVNDVRDGAAHGPPPSSAVTLEDNVWICTRSIVYGGVTIGTGSVIAAGSVVTDDIPPRSLAAGSPARVIRTI